jgi:hypothetical protein
MFTEIYIKSNEQQNIYRDLKGQITVHQTSQIVYTRINWIWVFSKSEIILRCLSLSFTTPRPQCICVCMYVCRAVVTSATKSTFVLDGINKKILLMQHLFTLTLLMESHGANQTQLVFV